MNTEALIAFFTKEIDPVQFALYIRRFNHVVITNELIRIDKTCDCPDLLPIIDGLYWSNALAELIDPYLEKEC